MESAPHRNVTTKTNNKQQSAAGHSDEPSRWSIRRLDTAVHASNARFSITLTGRFGIGEVTTVDLGIFNVNTDSSTYTEIMTAISIAVAANPNVTFDLLAGKLTYTSRRNSSSLTNLVLDLPLTCNGTIEKCENFTLRLSNPTTSIGKIIKVDPNGESATTVVKNKPPLTQWFITGLTTFDDLDNPSIVIGLTGTFDKGEIITVDLGLTYVCSKRGSYTDILTAIAISVAANPDLTFNILTDKLTYTSPTNRASMTDIRIELPLTNDGFINGPEDFSLRLSNPTASTDTRVEVNPTLANISTLTGDTQSLEGSEEGPAQSHFSDPLAANKPINASRTNSPSDALDTNEVIVVSDGLTDDHAKHNNKANLQTTIDTPATTNLIVVNEPAACLPTSDSTPMNTPSNDLPLTSGCQTGDTDGYNQSVIRATASKARYNEGDLCEDRVTTSNLPVASSDDGPALWSITGPSMVVDGDNSVFVVSLGGNFQIGALISADINLIGIDTNSSSFTNAIAAISSAADTNPAVTFDGATLTFTASADSTAMTDLIIALTIRTEATKKSSGLFSLGLSHATSNTNILTGIRPGAQSIITSVNSSGIATIDSCHTMINTAITGHIPINTSSTKGNPAPVSLVNGNPCNAAIGTAAGGSIFVNTDGTYRYRPAVGFIGQDNIIIATRDAAGSFIESILSIEVCNPSISQPPIDPKLALVANNDCFSTPEDDQQQSEFSIDEHDPDKASITQPKTNDTALKKTIHLSDTAKRVADLHSTNELDFRAHFVDVPRAFSSPSDQAIIDNYPPIQPADGPQSFSINKEIEGTSSTIEGDSCGKIIFNSKVSGDVININVHDTIAAQSNKIRKYSATLRNGQSLPGWINFNQDGSFSIAKSIDSALITLRLIALLDSGNRTTLLFEVNTLTSEIYLLENISRPTTRPSTVHA